MTQPAVQVQVAFAVDPFTEPSGGQWDDITTRVREAWMQRGRNHELERAVAGELQLRLRNTDRRFDPLYTAGPYFPNVKPMRHVRVRAVHGGSTYDLFRGFIEDWGQEYGGRPLDTNGDALAQVRATDAFKLFGLRQLLRYSAEVLADGPVGYWRLREATGPTALDESATVPPTNGTYGADVVEGGATGPLLGGSLAPDFPGTANSVVSTTAPAVLNLTGDMTIEFWVRLDTAPGANGSNLVSSTDPYQTSATSTRRIRFQNSAAGGTFTLTGASQLTLGVWYHAAVTRERATGRVRMFLNGVEDATPLDVQGAVNNNFGGLNIAGAFLGYNALDGKLAHVALYDRTLSPERIRAHYLAKLDTFVAQATGSAMGAILDSIGWPSALRSIDAGSSTMQGHDPEGNVLEHLLRLTDSENGLLVMGGDGKVVFHDRASLFKSPHTAVQATLGDRESFGYVPTAVANLGGWWKADDPGSDYAEGQKVSQWVDRSGNARHLANATSNEQPTYRRGHKNGRGAMTFLGGQRLFTSAFGPFAQPNTIIVAGRFSSIAAGSALVDGIATGNKALIGQTTTQWQLSAGTSQVGGAADTIAHVFTAVFDASDTLWVDQVSAIAANAGAHSLTGLVVGANASGSGLLTGELYEVLWWTRALTAGERAGAENYLNRKWGLTGWTAPAHPDDELPYRDIAMRYDDQDLYTRVIVEREGGIAQVAEDVVAQTTYGLRELSRSGSLTNSDLDSLGAAQYLLARFKDPRLRVDKLVLTPGNRDDLFAQVLVREPHHDRVRVRRRPPGGGSAIEQESHLEGLRHRVTPGKSWETEWSLVPADPFSYWLLGDSTYSVLGTTTRPAY